MRIICPSCAAEYEVMASHLKPGRLVRCANCGGEWLPVHEVEEAAPPPAVMEPEPEPFAPPPVVTAMDRLAQTAPVQSAVSRALIGAWILAFVIMIGAATSVVVWRREVIRTWPASAFILDWGGDTAHDVARTAGKKPE